MGLLSFVRITGAVLAAGVALLAAPSVRGGEGAVFVNARALAAGELRSLEQRFGIRAQPGRYWYDRMSGAWGFEDGPTIGFVPAGLSIGGALRADASVRGAGGATGVFINGRQLHALDVLALSQFVRVMRGRWWVDGQGWFGPEGEGGRGPAWGNLWWLAQQRFGANSPYSGMSRDGRHSLGRDANGCMYYQGSNLAGGATFHASSGC